MRGFGFTLLTVLLVFRPCCSRSMPEEDPVVSVYTTLPTTAGTRGYDVYHQIANNIAERITSPIYRFLRIGQNKTEDHPATKKPWQKIELLDELPDEVPKSANPEDNDISEDKPKKDRDVEELSVEALRKMEKKPEKITLYTSYLPVNGKLERNATINEINVNDDDDDDDEPFEFDDDDEKPREGGFVYILEFLGSLFQLAWGALESVFKPSTSNKDEAR